MSQPGADRLLEVLPAGATTTRDDRLVVIGGVRETSPFADPVLRRAIVSAARSLGITHVALEITPPARAATISGD